MFTRAAAAGMALTLAIGSSAFAQDRGQRDDRGRNDGDRRGNEMSRNNDHGQQGDRRGRGDGRNDRWRNGDRGYMNREWNGQEWRRGARLPAEYRHPQYYVNDWRGHHLSAPPRGYRWVQHGNDYVLVAITTGIISQLLLNHQ